MKVKLPRIVLVTRRTLLELLLERHGTLSQARFYLQTRGEDIRGYEEAHQRFGEAFAKVTSLLNPDQRRVRVEREQLNRFLFAPEDLVLIIGQDGLVPNTAKYLDGQVTVGINPDPERYAGVLVPHAPGDVPKLLEWLSQTDRPPYKLERRTMVVARREDGQSLLALNEVFVGHRSHQSALYRIEVDGQSERHSSSGLICASGTGSTGWITSIARQRSSPPALPAPEEKRLAWFVREPWPSVWTRAELDQGLLLAGQELVVYSNMAEGGVVFADGIESDRLDFLSGHSLRISLADRCLNLVMPN